MRRIAVSRSNIRPVLFALLMSAGAAAWLVLANASALAPGAPERPAGAAAMERLRDAHASVAQQADASAQARQRDAAAANATLAGAREAAVAVKTPKLAAALPPAPRRPAIDAARAAPADKSPAAAATLDKPAGPPVNLAFVGLSSRTPPSAAPPSAAPPRKGLLDRIALAAEDIGAGAWDTLSAAARLPAKVLPSRFL